LKRHALTTLTILIAAGIGSAAAQNRGGRGPGIPAPIKITVSAFSDGGEIPSKYTCAAQPAGGSFDIQWSGAPEGTVTYALILHDPDVHIGKGTDDVTHWIAWNIPANVHELSENLAGTGELPDGTRQGNNVARRTGYMGPCPPPGLPHHYTLEIYALDTKLDLAAGASRADLAKAVDGHIIASGDYIGLFKR